MTSKPIEGNRRHREFRKLAEYAVGLLSEERRNLLKIGVGGGSIDWSEWLIRRKKWDRYLPPESRSTWDQKMERARWSLDRLVFLFGSGVPDHIVGHLITEAVLDSTTLGSQVWHLRSKTLEWRGRRRSLGSTFNFVAVGHRMMWDLHHPCIGTFRRHLPMLQEQYPQMTPEDLVRDLGRRGMGSINQHIFIEAHYPHGAAHKNEQAQNLGNEFTFFDQLTFRYSYYLFKLFREEDYGAWFEGILRRYRWHLEKIALSKGTWNENKYREGFLRLLSEELTGDSQRSRYPDCVFPFMRQGKGSVTINRDEVSEGIIEEVLGCFGEEQLKLLESKDSRGNTWSFGQQMRDRFSYRRPSFASMDEIRENVRRKVSLYGPLINGETAEVIGDILLDDFDGELFVTEATHRWNQEMKKEETEGVDAKVLWAVDRILESIDASLLEKLPRNLKTLLLSRWKRARLAGSRRRFRRFLDELHIHTIHCPRYWAKENLSGVDLQAFLGQLDPMFLYPREGRIFKLLGNRNDVGLVLGRRRDGEYMPANPLIFILGLLVAAAVIGLWRPRKSGIFRLKPS